MLVDLVRWPRIIDTGAYDQDAVSVRFLIPNRFLTPYSGILDMHPGRV